MASNIINDKIAQAIDTLIEKRIENKIYDITEIGKIFSIVDSEQGIYKVNINSGIYLAYNIVQGATYKKEDEVYIKIPQGNYELKLLIEGTASIPKKDDGNENLIEMSPKFIYNPLLEDETQEFGLIAGLNTNIPLWELYGYKKITTQIDNDPEDFQREFIKLLTTEKAKYLQISADFKTTLINTHTKGNYGLILQFKKDGEEKEILYKRFDISDFIGQIYDYEIEYFTQKLLIDLEDLKQKDENDKLHCFYLDKIIFFEENFDIDIDLNTLELEENVQNPNIFVKNIKAIFLKEIDEIESNKEYSAELIAENGYVTDKDIKIELKLYNKDKKEITDEEKYYIYWFKKMYPAYANKSGYTLYDYNAYDGICATAGTDRYNWLSINNYDDKAVNEDGQNIYGLYQEELKLINKNYKDKELAIKQKELLDKYGYKKNLLQIQTNVENELEYKVVVYKEKYDAQKNNIPIIEKTFILQSKNNYVNPKDIEISTIISNIEIEKESQEKDEQGNTIKEKYIKGINFAFKLPEGYYGNWEFIFKYYNSNNELLQEEKINNYSKYGPGNDFNEKNEYIYSFNLKSQIKEEEAVNYYVQYDYKCFISYSADSSVPGAIGTRQNILIDNSRYIKPLGFKEQVDQKYWLIEPELSTETLPEEEESQATLFSLQTAAPENYISDSILILKEDTGEFLSLKDYIQSYLLDKNI